MTIFDSLYYIVFVLTAYYLTSYVITIFIDKYNKSNRDSDNNQSIVIVQSKEPEEPTFDLNDKSLLKPENFHDFIDAFYLKYNGKSMNFYPIHCDNFLILLSECVKLLVESIEHKWCDDFFDIIIFPCNYNKSNSLYESFGVINGCISILNKMTFAKARGAKNRITSDGYDKFCVKYNKCLTHIKSSVSNTIISSSKIVLMRKAITSIHFIDRCVIDKEHIIVRKNDVVIPLSKINHTTDNGGIGKKNFDGTIIKKQKVYKNESFVLKTSQSLVLKDSKWTLVNKGITFSFESVDEFFSLLHASCENVVPEQLIFLSVLEAMKIKNKILFGNNDIRRINVCLDKIDLQLRLIHTDPNVKGVINMSSDKITNLLIDKQQKSIDMKLVQSNFNGGYQYIGSHWNLRHYIKFHNIVNKIITQQINNTKTHIYLTCLRQECGKQWLEKAPNSNTKKESRCIHCNRFDICRVCLKHGHGEHPCDKPDEASILEIKTASKNCPNCNINIIRNDGCSHMTCKCGAHFCWQCGIEFSLSEINHHIMHSGCSGYDRTFI